MSNSINLKKRDLVGVLKSLGFDEKTIEWMYKRNTAQGLITIIENCRTHDIISDLAKTAGKERNA